MTTPSEEEKHWKSPPGDYCQTCDTSGSRATEQIGNEEHRTCGECKATQIYVTK